MSPNSRRALTVGSGLAMLLILGLAASPALSQASPADHPGLSNAWGSIQVANWPAAIRTLTELESSVTDPAVKARVLYLTAYVWQVRKPGEDLDRAKTYYQRVIDEHARSGVAPWAMMNLARSWDMSLLQKDRQADRAREMYRRIVNEFPGHVMTHEATVWLASSRLARKGDPNEQQAGRQILFDWLADHPDNYLASTMHYLIGKSFQQQEKWSPAIRHLALSYEKGLPTSGDRASVCFAVAQIAQKKLRDYRLAARWYQEIVDHVQRDNKYFISKLLAEKCRRLAEGADVEDGDD